MNFIKAPFVAVQFQVVTFPRIDGHDESVRVYALDDDGSIWSRLLDNDGISSTEWLPIDEEFHE